MTDSFCKDCLKNWKLTNVRLDLSTEAANTPSNLGSPQNTSTQNTSTPIKEQQFVPESLSNSIKFLIKSQQRQF